MMAIEPLANLAQLPTDLFIGGRWRPASSGRRIDVIDPATEEPIASVADATLEDAAAAVEAAAAAAPAFAKMPPRQGEIAGQALCHYPLNSGKPVGHPDPQARVPA